MNPNPFGPDNRHNQNYNQGFNQSYDQPNAFTNSTGWTVAESPEDVRMAFIQKTYVLFLAGILSAIVMGGITLSTPLFGVSLALLKIPCWLLA